MLDPRHLVDVFVYVVVLNVAIEYAPAVVSETFTLSLLTAVLLKLVLEGVVWLKKRARARLADADSRAGRALSVAMLAVLLPGSKIVVIELTDWVFGDRVSLGGFWAVTALVLVLLAARWAVRLALPADGVVGAAGGASGREQRSADDDERVVD